MQVIRNGLVFDPSRGAEYVDLLIDSGFIADIVAPGAELPADTELIDASDRILIPGLINAHTRPQIFVRSERPPRPRQ